MTDHKKLLFGIVVSNLLGAVVIFFYFAYVDLETYYSNKAFWRGSDADWLTFSVAMIFASVVIGMIGARWAWSLQKWQRRIQAGESVTEAPIRVRQLAATYPLLLAGVSAVIWILVGVFFAQGGLKFLSTDARTFSRTLLGVSFVGGLLNATLVFLIAESIWRNHLPKFFPYGHMRILDAPRVTVRLRLGAIFLISGLIPLIVIGAAAQNSAQNAINPLFEPQEALMRLEYTVFFVVAAGLVANVLIGTFSTRSLLQPIERLAAAMGHVARGNMTVHLDVESNDELGDLTEDFNYMVSELKQGQRMRDLFGRYVSREVAEQILSNGADLGGESVPATALFADIRDFTGLSERLPAKEVVAILNRYYTRMVDVIVDEGGMVNKFGGDSLLAIFGAPIRQPDHALRAVRAAWQMTRALGEFNAEQTALGLSQLTVGIGISSGEVVAGNVGGNARLEYTIIGDPVNLASRLQALSKKWEAPILLSEETRRHIRNGAIRTKPRNLINVRGKQIPTMVYELRGLAT